MIPLTAARSLSKHFNGIAALADFSFTVAAREILGLLGPNGAGKTTLFNVLTGILTPDSGTAEFKGQILIGWPIYRIANLGVARTFQNLRLIGRITVLENILLCFKRQPGENLLKVFFRPSLCRRHEDGIRDKAMELLKSAGIADIASELAGNLSYGQQKLLSLLCCLAADAELLLLDEPVAGIAPEMADRILSIIANLPNQGKSVIVIEHDIDALKGIADRMIFMDAGRKICEGDPDEVLSDPRVIEAYLD